MQITDRFVVEHQVFLRQLAFLEDALSGPPDTLLGVLRTIVQMLHDPLKAHADAEEALLFPELEQRMGGDTGALPVMVAEHRDIQATIDDMGRSGDRARARRLVEHLVDVLREHIAKEDDLLFPTARELLGAERLEELDARYSRVPAGAAFPG